jgi:hypothetical protein
MQDGTLLKNVELFVQKMGCGWLHIDPFSPDLAPQDFFLFGHVQNRLEEIVFQPQEELLAGIREVLDEILVEALERVLQHWMKGFEWIFSEQWC